LDRPMHGPVTESLDGPQRSLPRCAPPLDR
jgi:hypothetical protein